MGQAIFKQWPKDSRRTWGWAAVPVVVLAYVLSAAPVFIAAIGLSVLELAGGASEIEAQGVVTAFLSDWLLATVVVQFFLWAVLIWLWARVFEKRKSPTFGLNLSPLMVLRYLIGLPLGLVLVVAIGQVAVWLGAPLAETGEGLAGLERLADPMILLSLAGVACVFLIQGGAEEIVFRGWLMSTLAARWGVRAGVIASSLVFMVFHAHVFISGLMFGVIALAGLGAMGLVFALLSLVTRSIVEAVAAHGAFNAAALIVPVAIALAENPERSFSDVFGDIFTAATGTAGVASTTVGPEMFAQGLAAGGIAAILAVILLARRRSPAWREEAVEPSASEV